MGEVQGELEEDARTPHDEQSILCTGGVDVLFENYLGIFPLWSGAVGELEEVMHLTMKMTHLAQEKQGTHTAMWRNGLELLNTQF